MNLVIATRNLHKTREFAQLLGPEFQVSDLNCREAVPPISETGSTFAQNAIHKARVVSKSFPHELVIADDSGLEVDALGGAPGVRSARYAGEHASDRENLHKLLNELQKTLGAARSARFRCVVAVCQGDELLHILGGAIHGHIAEESSGTNGFGYDPVFMPEGFGQTFAEISPELKNQLSHRGQALSKLRALLTDSLL